MALGADLLILAVDAPRGTVRMPVQLGFALAAAELVDLASARRIEAADGRIQVTEQLRTGDPVLDETLRRLAGDPKGSAIDHWITMHAPDRVQVHIAALLQSGELHGKLVSTRLNVPPEPRGLRVAGINPAYEEPWRLLIRLAVQEAVKRAEAKTRKSVHENGLSKDVQNAIALSYAIEHRL